MRTTEKFFDESKEQSLIKAEIVSKYFWAWAKVILPTTKKLGKDIAYIDLFSGPGRYKDGAKSTPILILEQALNDEDIRQRLITIFNDASSENSSDLLQSIREIPNISNLSHEPIVSTSEVGEEIVKLFEKMQHVPTLFFVDPWGYKGLSLRLINSVLKDWGCDCIFFFNYNRINMGLCNPMVKEHMDALFGEERADRLRLKLEHLTSAERELEILEAISQSLNSMGGNYVLPFTFKNSKGNRTSHHLIFVSKHVRGYEIMKEIMAKQSSTTSQGVPSFVYSQATENQPFLFDFSRRLDELCEMLTTNFAGKTLSMQDLYEKHHVGKPYIKANYKDALNKLEIKGRIIAEPPAEKRRKIKGKQTFADNVLVSFPKEHH